MAGEIPAGQLSQRLLALQRSRGRDAFVEQGIRELPPPACAAADHAVELGPHHQVRKTLYAVSHNACALQHALQLLTCELRAAAQRPGQHPVAAPEYAGVQPELAVVRRHRGFDAWAGEREHPADVGGSHEMPSGPHDVGTENRPFGKRALDGRVGGAPHPQRKRPFRAGVVLGLDRAQPAHHLFRFGEAGGGQALIAKPCAQEIELKATLAAFFRQDARTASR